MSLWQPGNYKGDLVAWAFPPGKKGGVEIHLKFEIEGQAKWVYLYTSDAAWPHTEDKLRALGWNGSTDDDKADFANKTGVEIYCKIEPAEGTYPERERWDVSKGPREAAPADARKVLEARYKQSGGAPTKPATRPAPPPAAKSAPPPAAKSGPPAKGANFFNTKDQTWGYWEKCYDAEKKAVDTTLWHKAVAAAGPDEDNFGPAEWTKVADACPYQIPF